MQLKGAIKYFNRLLKLTYLHLSALIPDLSFFLIFGENDLSTLRLRYSKVFVMKVAERNIYFS